jgi:hypothetical protein
MVDRPIWSQEQPRNRKRLIAALLVVGLFLAGMSRLEFFREYLGALWPHWITLMSGVVSVAITFWEKIHDSIGKYVLYTVAAMCVFLAGFQAWQDEHKRANELARPKIDLSENLDWMQTSTQFQVRAPGGPVEHTFDTTIKIVAFISIRNRGVPTVLENWGLHLTWPDGRQEDVWPWIKPPTGDLILTYATPPIHTFTFHAADYLLTKTVSAMQSGEMTRGFLYYEFLASMTIEKLQTTKAQIVSLDVVGNKHTVDLQWDKHIGPEYPVFPGVTEEIQ